VRDSLRGAGGAGLLLAVAIAWLSAGCGRSSGPARYDVSGKVSYGQAPVPAGRIVFEPDDAKGNSGPPSYAQIKEGRYATPPGKGTVGGPHRVRITGFDGRGAGESPDGTPLFSEYRASIDLPKEDATRDLDVPATHK